MTTETIHPQYATCQLDYARLERITTVEKPYRGSTNRYPIESRKYSHKCFYEEMIDGEKVYKIAYGKSWTSISITQEQYKLESGKNNRVYKRGHNDYIKYIGEVNIVGVVYPDRSFEFLANDQNYGVGQGLKIHINGGWLPYIGYIRSSKKHGGVVISRRGSNRTDEILHPVFKGLRIYTDTFETHPKCQYKVVGYKTVIKNVREAMKPYEEAFKVADVMFRNMEINSILDIAEELHKDCDKPSYTHPSNDYKIDNELIRLSSELSTQPLDTAINMAWEYNLNSIRTAVKTRSHSYYSNYNWSTTIKVHTLANNIKRKFRDALCRTNNTTLLKLVEYEAGTKYPASIWGYDVMLNNEVMMHYR